MSHQRARIRRYKQRNRPSNGRILPKRSCAGFESGRCCFFCPQPGTLNLEPVNAYNFCYHRDARQKEVILKDFFRPHAPARERRAPLFLDNRMQDGIFSIPPIYSNTKEDLSMPASFKSSANPISAGLAWGTDSTHPITEPFKGEALKKGR